MEIKAPQNTNDIYKWIRIGGAVSAIPFVLAAGPVGGYLLGRYLQKVFHLKEAVTIVFIFIGLAGGLFQTVRIVKIVLKMDRKVQG